MKLDLIQSVREFELEFFLALVLLFLFVLCAITLYPPITDFPQHLSQLYLLENYPSEQNLKLNLVAPNNLVYFLMTLLNLAFSKIWVSKLTIYLLMASWVFANYLLAKRFKANKYSFLLSCMVMFNLTLYWGFLNFVSGWLFFAILLVIIDKYIESGKKKYLYQIGVVSIFLFASHILWFAVGCFVIALHSLLNAKQLKKMFFLCVPMFPVGFYSLYWVVGLSRSRGDSGFDVGAHWLVDPIERLSFEYLSNSVFGGLTGYIELLILAALVVWGGVSGFELIRKKQISLSSKALLVPAMLLLVIVLFAPDKYLNTIAFAQRWTPCAFTLILLSMPKPDLDIRVLPLALVLVSSAFYLDTARRWYYFEHYELSGLKESLSILPENKKVLGLDYVKISSLIKGRPFLQTFAYAQYYRGAEINFSFAEHGTGVVVYDQPRETTWSPGLEWFAERATVEDLQKFDYVLVHGSKDTIEQLARLEVMELVQGKGRWVLFRVHSTGQIDG